MSQQINLGSVTAYASAKDGGYVGTYAEFCTDLANSAELADTIRTDSMPTASSENVGDILQFIGTTTSSYTHGYFYECVEDDGTYSWVNLPVSEGGTQIQADWNQSDNTQVDYIKNKPNLSNKADLVSGKVPSTQLPSYVDDVIEGYYYNGAFYEESTHETTITGETGKIYVDLSTDNSYRWSGSAYVKINDVDLTNYVQKSQTAGLLKNDGTVDQTQYVSDISGKADKVTNATSGNLAGLDANGNLTDSGIDPTDLGGGHTILNGSGSAMNQRGKLQFTSKVADDSGNDKTIVYSGSEENITIGHSTGSSGTGKWITENNTIDGTVYPYRYSATLTKAIYGMPKIEYVATKGSGSSSAKATAFNCIAYVGHDPDYPTTLKLYATAVPTVDFNILVKWEGGSV